MSRGLAHHFKPLTDLWSRRLYGRGDFMVEATISGRGCGPAAERRADAAIFFWPDDPTGQRNANEDVDDLSTHSMKPRSVQHVAQPQKPQASQAARTPFSGPAIILNEEINLLM
ncbi:hypothetical protein E4U46_004409 [Claviceps purpurea]|nr:hypothetical protein E4U46_004409 [Claviceps purpurea]